MPLDHSLEPTPQLISGAYRIRIAGKLMFVAFRRVPLLRSRLHVWRIDREVAEKIYFGELPFRANVKHGDIATSFGDILPDYLLSELRLLSIAEWRTLYTFGVFSYETRRGASRARLALLRDGAPLEYLHDMPLNTKAVRSMLDRISFAFGLRLTHVRHEHLPYEPSPWRSLASGLSR